VIDALQAVVARTRGGASGSATTTSGSSGSRGTTIACIACTARCASISRDGRGGECHGAFARPSSSRRHSTRRGPIDFMLETLYDGRRFRTFNVMDESNRAGLAIEVGTTMPALRVIAVLEELVALHGAPRAIRCDKGPELTSLAVTTWCEQRGIALRYIQPGSLRRMRSSNASIAHTARKFSTPTSSRR
jgi:transposase InsO family protein